MDSGPSEREVPCGVGEYLARELAGIIVHAAECVRHGPAHETCIYWHQRCWLLGDKESSQQCSRCSLLRTFNFNVFMIL